MKISLETLRAWVTKTDTDREYPYIPERPETKPSPHEKPEPGTLRNAAEILAFGRFYNVFSVAFCLVLILILLITISWMPRLGASDVPASNEVAQRYIEEGLSETGAVNIVAGMILDYRAFDTFGESCVLFTAVCCVFVLLKKTPSEVLRENDRLNEPKNDAILQVAAAGLVPFGLLFGVYVILNGHLSAGGGFSGGAVLGACLILYLLAFGFEKTERFFTERTFRFVTVVPLTFYCLAKSYSFFTGANHLQSFIPLGTPGAILSSGLILPLNICVGMVVTCTMYAFYCMFRKGSF